MKRPTNKARKIARQAILNFRLAHYSFRATNIPTTPEGEKEYARNLEIAKS